MKQLTKKGIIATIIFSLTFVVCFPFLFISSGAMITTDAASWADSYKKPSGSGTPENPYNVYSAEGLAYFVYYTENVGTCAASIVLEQNIDLAGKEWAGIGNSKNPFTGSFDGQGHQIFNLSSNVGLFGYVNGVDSSNRTEIKNVWVNGEVYGNDRIAGIVGYVTGSVGITGCTNMCNVLSYSSSSSSYAAGIAGYVYGVGVLTSISIDQCANYGQIQNSSGYVAGIAGYLYRGNVANSFNAGNLTGAYAAGIVAMAQYILVVTHCYNANIEIIAGMAAGIILDGNNVGGIECCFDLRTVKENNYYPITNLASGEFNSNYKAVEGGGRGDFDADIHTHAKSKAWYKENTWHTTFMITWDLDTIWYVDDQNAFPILRNKLCIELDKDGGTGGSDDVALTIGSPYGLGSVLTPSKTGSSFWGYFTGRNNTGKKIYDFNGTIMDQNAILKTYVSTLYAGWGIGLNEMWSSYYTIPTGSGTTASPYLVNTPNELAYFAYLTRTKSCNAVVELAADIDLNGYYWEPIGNKFSFEGQFNGRGHTIQNLKVNNLMNAGLFGKVTGGLIQNVFLSSGRVEGRENIGGIAGYAINTQIINCYLSAINVFGNDVAVCAGGIVGLANDGGSIKSSYCAGGVNAAYHVGGILGRYFSNDSSSVFSIVDCYAQTIMLSFVISEKVELVHDVGGLVGSCETTGGFGIGFSFASGSYATNALDMDAGSIGGIIGSMHATGTIAVILNSGCSLNISNMGNDFEAHNAIYGTFNGTLINNSWGSIISSTTSFKVMVGTNFSDWGYSPYLNGGLPLLKRLSHALSQGNQDVYSYLQDLGFVQLSIN